MENVIFPLTLSEPPERSLLTKGMIDAGLCPSWSDCIIDLSSSLRLNASSSTWNRWL